jgi:hypothetical protein
MAKGKARKDWWRKAKAELQHNGRLVKVPAPGGGYVLKDHTPDTRRVRRRSCRCLSALN